MTCFKGIIFDFNGTLLWDTPLHNLSWDRYLTKYSLHLSDLEKHENLHGKTNKDIFEYLFKRKLASDELERVAEEKEHIYRDLCLETDLQLADGAIELFDYCNGHSIPIAIATSSGKINVDFYIERYKLLNWFSAQRIVYNDGSLKSKPDPEIFNLTLKELKLMPEEVIIFEDSIAGIQAAENARAGKIMIVNSNQEEYPFKNHPIIDHIRRFDKTLLSLS